MGQSLARQFWFPENLSSSPVRPWGDRARHRASTGQKGGMVEESGGEVWAPLKGQGKLHREET